MEQSLKQLHSLRKSCKLKQGDVARMAGISREAHLRAESGRADPRLSTLMVVVGALRLEVVLAPREVAAEVERMIVNHPTQLVQAGGGGVEAGHERSEQGSMGSTGGGHGLAGQYRGPGRHPQSVYHPDASHSQAGQQDAPHVGSSAEGRLRMTFSDRLGAGGPSGGSDRPDGSGPRES